MTEEEARAWVYTRYGATKVGLLDQFAALVREEAERQNLVAPSTLTSLWTRHITDSAQLLAFAPTDARSWIDIGTGAGFPGMVVAILFDGQVTMVEPRSRRATFLRDVALALGCACVVHQARAETCEVIRSDIISARAVASIDDLLTITSRMRDQNTTYILPRGRSGAEDIERVRTTCRGVFHVEQSITDPESLIVIAQGFES